MDCRRYRRHLRPLPIIDAQRTRDDGGKRGSCLRGAMGERRRGKLSSARLKKNSRARDPEGRERPGLTRAGAGPFESECYLSAPTPVSAAIDLIAFKCARRVGNVAVAKAFASESSPDAISFLNNTMSS